MSRKKKWKPDIQDLPENIILRFWRPDFKRQADLMSDYRFRMDGFEFVIKANTHETDGASIPGLTKARYGGSYEPVNLWPAVPHDGGYENDIVIVLDDIEIPVYFTPAQMDAIFYAIRVHETVGGNRLNSWKMWLGIRSNSGILDAFRKVRHYPSLEVFLEKNPGGRSYTSILEERAA